MNFIRIRALPVTAAFRTSFTYGARRCSGCLLALVLASLCAALAQTQEDVYLKIYALIEQADGLADKGKTDQALAKYAEAQTALKGFQKANRNWSTKMVSYRATYVADRIAALSPKPAPPIPTNAPEASSASASTPPEAQKAAKPASSVPALPLKLLGAGSEPRQALRLHPKTGDKQTLTTSMKLNVDMTMADMPSQAIKTPAMTLTAEVTVKDVSPAGDITCDLTITDAGVANEPGAMSQVIDALKPALDKMKGQSGTVIISDRGASKGLELNTPAESEAQTRQIMALLKDSFAMLSVPLPEQPVGPGARCETRNTIKSQGVNVDQTTTFELASADGDQLALKSTIAQRAPNQKMEFPAMPSLKFDLNNMTGKGSGETSLNLAQLMPSKSSADLQSDFTLGANIGGQPRTVSMKLGMKFQLEAK